MLRYVLLLLSIFASGCYFMRGSSGGGETEWQPPRKINTEDVALLKEYQIEKVAEGFTFPTSITFDDDGNAYVVESGYSYGEVFTTPRLIRIGEDGSKKVIAEGSNNGPWTAVFFHENSFIVTEGGQMEGGKILRISQSGEKTELLSGLPSKGDHHTNGAIVGPDGYIYFGQGTATNSAVVGIDNYQFGWLKRFPEFHDNPCEDIELTGENYETDNPLTEAKDKATTGAFSPFNQKTTKGQVIKGKVPCSGSIMRIPVRGGDPELVAWGFRNPFGLAFSPDENLYVVENGYDDRGSRPVWGSGDYLWKVDRGGWYGWPDFVGSGYAVDTDMHEPPGEPKPKRLINNSRKVPSRPVAYFGVHSSSNGIDFSRSKEFGFEGEAFIAQFGDQAPTVGKVLHPVGYKVVRVNVNTGVINDFAVNKGKENGPGSLLGSGGLERPVAVRFSPDGNALYVVDFGVMLMSSEGAKPQSETGVIWKITRRGGQ